MVAELPFLSLNQEYMKMISLLLLISISTVHAAPATTTAVAPTSGTTTAAATPAPAAAPAPQPWKLAYFGEYVGPRLSNFDLARTQGPLDAAADYTSWGHSLKIGYAISSDVVLGTQIRAGSPFDPTKTLAWRNLRFYASWKHMIDTSDVDMQGVVDVELPNSTGARSSGMIVAFNIKNNWTFKTSLRNWSFSAMTMIRPMFYNIPTGKTDIFFGFYPCAQLDLAADWSFLFEGNFDASHSYNDTYFNFGQDDPDSMNFGIQYSINSHIQVNPALTFYTTDFTVPILYFSLSASL